MAGNIWAPTTEVGCSEDAFLPVDPRGMIETATIPLLTGLNYAEGGYTSVRKSHVVSYNYYLNIISVYSARG